MQDVDATIHEYLVVHVKELLVRLRHALNTGPALRSAVTVLFWPTHDIAADDGTSITRVITMHLEETTNIPEVLRGGVERTDAFAFLCIHTKEHEAIVTLESKRSVDTWVLPREWHGDVLFTKEPVNVKGKALGVLQEQG
jgi:hypothetical protein